jgi:hypothetical protein
MSQYIHRARLLIGVPATAALLAIAACGGSKSDNLAQDTSLASDIQMANTDTTVQPQLTDVPPAATPAPAPAAKKPAPTPKPAPARTEPAKSTTASGNTVTKTPSASETALGTIAAGTSIPLTSDSKVCTNTNKVGETVTATVASAVSGSNGAVIPAGAKVSMAITQLKRSENARDQIEMGFSVKSVSFGGRTYPVTASVSSATIDRIKNQPGAKDAQKVATGAAIGAVVGKIIGHSTKSTVIGAAVGAAGGAGAAATTSNYEGCVAAGGKITIALDNSVQVHT